MELNETGAKAKPEMCIVGTYNIKHGDDCKFSVHANKDLSTVTLVFNDTTISCNYRFLASNMGACEELRHILDVIRQDVEVGDEQ